MSNPNDRPAKLDLEMAREKYQRGFALLDLRRSIHAGRANQLRDQASSMHRWVMASLLVLNTGAMVTLLNRDGVDISDIVTELACWALGACVAILSGSLHSAADLMEAEIWQDLASADYELDSGHVGREERDRARKRVYWVRVTAGGAQGAGYGLFAAGLLHATGYL